MIISLKLSAKLIPQIFLLWLLLACEKEEEPLPETEKPVNYFSLNLGNELWEPTTFGDGPCTKAFHGAWTFANNKDQMENAIFAIRAYNGKETSDETNFEREESFILQLKDIKATGKYLVDENYYGNSFGSFVMFNIKTPEGASKKYVNKTEEASFFVEIEEIFPIESSTMLQGLKGNFNGILYNEENPLDSIVVEAGEFKFGKVNWYNFDQCEHK